MSRNVSIWVLALVLCFAGDAFAGEEKKIITLGKALYEDPNLSLNSNQSCMTCHHPSAGFADPDNAIAPTFFPVSRGSDGTSFGGRNAPSAAYAAFSPVLHYDAAEELFIGGVFWDGRASGTEWSVMGSLADPLAEQAKGPFLNPGEMKLSSKQDVVEKVKNAEYAKLFRKVFGDNAFADTEVAYDNIGIAIAEFERSEQVNQFESRFDKFAKEQGGDVSTFGVEILPGGFRQYVGPPEGFKSNYLSFDEADGLALFNADSDNQGPSARVGGMCYACHSTENHVTDEYSMFPAGEVYPPMFTDFSYDNLGIPKNKTITNLAGDQDKDFGLGAPSRVDELLQLNPALVIGGQGRAKFEKGKFKVASLRNVAVTAPYGHNGFFPTLYSVVHFYNTRDVGDWKKPEVKATVNTDELGNLGLNFEQEKKLVMFMQTLTDED